MKKEIITFAFFGLLVLALGGIIYFFVSGSQNNNAHTKLYFEVPEILQRRIEQDDTFDIYFAIENHEGRAKTYDYWIVQEGYSDKQLISSQIIEEKSVYIKDSSKAVQKSSFGIADKISDIVKIRIILKEQGQEIHFWSDVYDKSIFNKTIYCGIDVTDYGFDVDDWDRNYPEIVSGMNYCERYRKE